MLSQVLISTFSTFSTSNSLIFLIHQSESVRASTGVLTHTTQSLDDAARENLLKSGPIRCIAVDTASTHIVTTGDDKKLKVWKIADALELVSER